MPYTTLLFEIRDAVATVTVNRPEKLNALNGAVIAELGAVADTLRTDPSILGAILTGAGPKAFVAGADIGEIAAQGPVDGKARALEGQRVFRSLERCGKPVIAAVNGFALGGGCELAMACHLRVASEQARFGQPEVKLGIGPGYGGTVRLPRLVGKGRALELLLTGQMIDAQEAYRIGLVNRVVPADRLMSESEQILRAILENGPLAVRACLEAVDTGLDVGVDQALLLEANLFGLLSGTADMREGTAAFSAKRSRSSRGRKSRSRPAFHPPFRLFLGMPAKPVWGILVALLLGCDERERLTFETEPDDTVGPSSSIDPPSSDTTLTADDVISSFVLGARTVDPSGIDTVFIEVEGANLSYLPIDANGDDTVSFAVTIPIGNLAGRTIVVGVHGVDVIGNVGPTVSRRLTIE